eukprot:scaffold14535_cov127-Isochrysis_galbana.AAC.3
MHAGQVIEQLRQLRAYGQHAPALLERSLDFPHASHQLADQKGGLGALVLDHVIQPRVRPPPLARRLQRLLLPLEASAAPAPLALNHVAGTETDHVQEHMPHGVVRPGVGGEQARLQGEAQEKQPALDRHPEGAEQDREEHLVKVGPVRLRRLAAGALCNHNPHQHLHVRHRGQDKVQARAHHPRAPRQFTRVEPHSKRPARQQRRVLRGATQPPHQQSVRCGRQRAADDELVQPVRVLERLVAEPRLRLPFREARGGCGHSNPGPRNPTELPNAPHLAWAQTTPRLRHLGSEITRAKTFFSKKKTSTSPRSVHNLPFGLESGPSRPFLHVPRHGCST